MSNQDFPRTRRLLTGQDYSAVFNNTNIKIQLPHFLVLATKTTNTCARLGCIVAKKHIKRANQRNRIKRLIRETFRLNQHTLATFDIIVMIKPKITEQDNKNLFQELSLLWQKPDLIKER